MSKVNAVFLILSAFAANVASYSGFGLQKKLHVAPQANIFSRIWAKAPIEGVHRNSYGCTYKISTPALLLSSTRQFFAN